MIPRVASLLILLAFAGCRRAPEPPAAQALPKDTIPVAAPLPDLDGDNLLNLAYGASAVSRTGEMNLETSVVHAIDGMSFTSWSSPPGGAASTLVFALGAPSRIEKLGVSVLQDDQAPEKVRFSASNDARAWRDVVTIAVGERGTKIEPVPPFEARYLRVETIESKKNLTTLVSVHALGSEVRPPERHSFAGCWTINGLHATLTQNGARITGIIEGGSAPTYLDGGIEGRVARLMWMRGPMWGQAMVSLTPDGRGLSAVTFHEEAIFDQVGEAWIGERCDAISSTTLLAPAGYLRRAGHWTLSGVVFDADQVVVGPSAATLDALTSLIRAMPSERLRIVAHELRNSDADANRRRSIARVNALRDALRARGVDVSRIEFTGRGREGIDYETPSSVQRMLWSRLDLEHNRVP